MVGSQEVPSTSWQARYPNNRLQTMMTRATLGLLVVIMCIYCSLAAQSSSCDANTESGNRIVELNVGGTMFSTTEETLRSAKGSELDRMMQDQSTWLREPQR